MTTLASYTEEALAAVLVAKSKRELMAYAVSLNLVDAKRNYTVASLKNLILESRRFEVIAKGRQQ